MNNENKQIQNNILNESKYENDKTNFYQQKENEQIDYRIKSNSSKKHNSAFKAFKSEPTNNFM